MGQMVDRGWVFEKKLPDMGFCQFPTRVAQNRLWCDIQNACTQHPFSTLQAIQGDPVWWSVHP
jgi:hypothetical protein